MGILQNIINFFQGEPETVSECMLKNSIFQTCAFCGKPAKYRIKETAHFVYVCQDDKETLYPVLQATGQEKEF